MRLTLPIREVIAATPRAFVVRLALGGRTFSYEAGQAVVVGAPGQPDRNPYSLAGAPGEARARDELELLIGLDAAEVRSQLGELAPGVPLEIEGPFGGFTFPVSPAEQRFLFVAGGTGIAPLRAMMQQALASVRDPQIALVYSARTWEEFAYGPELRALAAAGRLTLWQTVTRDPGADWRGAKGRIALPHLRSMVQHPETLCFVCGPHALVRAIPPLLAELGVDAGRIRVEDWSTGNTPEISEMKNEK